MKAICYTCPGFGLYDVPEPEIQKEDDVLVKIAYAGICGSDINIIHGQEDKFLGVRPGEKFILGHEASGTIVKLGSKAREAGWEEGDKVAMYYNEHCGHCYYCRNGQQQFCLNMKLRAGYMTEYVSQNIQQLYKLPDNVDLLKAALIEPTSVVQRGIELCHIKAGSKVAVSGGGSIGLLFVELLRLAGAAGITVIEPVEEKRITAETMGADYTIDPLHKDVEKICMEITNGLGYDAVIETSGVTGTIDTCYKILSRGGTLELFAGYKKGSVYPIELDGFFNKEAKIVGVFQSPYMFERTAEFYKRLNLEPFIKHVYPPGKWKYAFEYRMGGEPQKVIFDFQQG